MVLIKTPTQPMYCDKTASINAMNDFQVIRWLAAAHNSDRLSVHLIFLNTPGYIYRVSVWRETNNGTRANKLNGFMRRIMSFERNEMMSGPSARNQIEINKVPWTTRAFGVARKAQHLLIPTSFDSRQKYLHSNVLG